ncbi:MAG: hypothetical protein V1835_04540 [Candidatus Micrarchaeota archaeon]
MWKKGRAANPEGSDINLQQTNSIDIRALQKRIIMHEIALTWENLPERIQIGRGKVKSGKWHLNQAYWRISKPDFGKWILITESPNGRDHATNMRHEITVEDLGESEPNKSFRIHYGFQGGKSAIKIFSDGRNLRATDADKTKFEQFVAELIPRLHYDTGSLGRINKFFEERAYKKLITLLNSQFPKK